MKKISSTDYDATNICVLPSSKNNSFYLFWQEGHSIKYSHVSSSGEKQENEVLQGSFPRFSKLSVAEQAGRIRLYGLDEERLWCYELDMQTLQVHTERIVAKGILTFLTIDNHLLYSDESKVWLINSKGDRLLASPVPAKFLNAVVAEDGLLYILTTYEEENWDVIFHYATYDKQRDKIRMYSRIPVGIEHRCVIVNASFDVDVKNKRFTILAAVKKVETLDDFGFQVAFPIENPTDQEIHQLDITGFHPNPTVIAYKDRIMSYIATAENKIGLTTSNLNLFLFQTRNGVVLHKEALTKTAGISSNPLLFTIGADQYLVWEDIDPDYKNLYFASTNKQVYELSKKATLSVYQSLIKKTLLGSFSALLLILLMSSIIAIFTVAILLIVSMLALNWMEANQSKLLGICMLLQLTANLGFTMHATKTLYKLQNILPSLLQHQAGILAVVTITTAIAAYCTKVKYEKNSQRSIFEQFLFFEALNLVLHALVYYPYYSL